MAKSFFKLDTRRSFSDGTYPVVLCVGFGRNTYIQTNIHAVPDDWDNKAQMYTGKNARSVNSFLDSFLTTATARILQLREQGIFDKIDTKQLRTYLSDPSSQMPTVSAGKSVSDMFRLVMATKSKRTAELYQSSLDRLNQYCDVSKVFFEDVNRLWLDGFVGSMRDLSPNTQSIHLRNLRAVNNYAIDCEVTQCYPFRRYKLPRQMTRKRSFKVDVIRNLASLPMGHNGIYRDTYKFLCRKYHV